MYAVIETGGKQYRVEVGTELEVELLDAEAGKSITLERVLLVADGAEAAVGTPLVADAAVDAEVVGRERGDKVIAFKYRPKARRRVKKGHRQELTVLRIADIRYQGRSAAEGAAKAPSKASERKRLEEAAARQAAEDAALAAKLNLAQPEEGAAEAEAKPVRRSRAKAGSASGTGGKATTAAKADAAAEAKADAAAEAKTPAAKKPAAKKPVAEAAPAKPARRRTTRSSKADDATAKADGGKAEPDAGATGDIPKAAPKRSRTKKDE